MKKPSNLIAGIIFFLIGMEYSFTKWDSFYEQPVPKSVGIFTIVIGIIFFISSFLGPSKKDGMKRFVVCENCKEKFKREHVTVFVCPKCDGKLVEVE